MGALLEEYGFGNALERHRSQVTRADLLRCMDYLSEIEKWRGANQPFTVDGGRTVRSLWGLIAVRLGGWKAYETIKSSDEARTNPGSEAMIAILKQAAPCLVLLDEVVAYARNLEGIPYDGFVSFLQSLTEAANAVPGVLVVGSLPESGAEVGNQRGREALLALEKVFGRVQSAWAPAQGTETFD
jgi:Protein of unknown function (DUF499)